MKKTYFTFAVTALLASAICLNSCIGSFALSKKVLDWNKNIGDKYVNEIVFLALGICQVYSVTALADLVVMNSIEFWTGNSPLAKQETKEVKGENGNYLVKTTPKGYEITHTDTQLSMDLTYDAINRSWSASDGQSTVQLIRFEDDNKAIVYAGENKTMEVELSQEGYTAYKRAIGNSHFVLR